MWAIEEDERPEDIAQALAIAEDPHTRQLLADLLGFQAAPAGVEALVTALSDDAGRVRSAAADALGKVFLSYPDLPERELAARLKAVKGPPGYEVRYALFPEETHNSGIPASTSRGVAFVTLR